MSIVTDSTTIQAPKDPDTDNVFALYKVIASETQISEMHARYLAGNYGYGDAKQELFELILSRFQNEREAFNYYISNQEELEKRLQEGEEKARIVIRKILSRVREKLRY